MYISETASTHLGLSQVELTGNCLTEYIHANDVEEMHHILTSTDTVLHKKELQRVLRQRSQIDINFDFEVPVSFFIRMKCVLPKRNAGLTNNGHKVIHCSGYLKVRHFSMDTSPMDTNMANIGLVAIGTSLPASTQTEIKMSNCMFMFRSSLDLKLTFVDIKVKELTGYDAQEILDKTLYQHIHPEDTDSMMESHRVLLQKGQVTTKYYRFLTRNGGYVWMQSYVTLVKQPRTTSRPECFVAVTYVVSERQNAEMAFSQNQMNPSPAYVLSSSQFLRSLSSLPSSCSAEQMAVGPEQSSPSDQVSPASSPTSFPVKRPRRSAAPYARGRTNNNHRQEESLPPHVPLLCHTSSSSVMSTAPYCVVHPMAEGSEQLSPSPPPNIEAGQLQQHLLQQLHPQLESTTTTSIPYPVIHPIQQQPECTASPPTTITTLQQQHHHFASHFHASSQTGISHPFIPVYEMIPHPHGGSVMAQEWGTHVTTDASGDAAFTVVYSHEAWDANQRISVNDSCRF